MIHTSSTIAFMKAKRSNARFMTVIDLKRILNNLNIDPPFAIIKKIYDDMDTDGDGEIECSEFLEYFGNYINGFAGSFETKPDWFYKEISDLSAHIDKIEGVHVTGPETVIEEEKVQEKKFKAPEKLTKQQELRFMRKYGVNADDLNYLNSTSPTANPANVSLNVLELNPSPMARPQSAGTARPKSAGASRPPSSGGWPQSVTQNRASGPAWGQPVERPRSASSERPRSAGSARPQSANAAKSKSARNIQSAVNFSTATMGLDDDDPFSALLHPMTSHTPAKETAETCVETTGVISDFSDGALLKELRERKQKQEGTFRSKSAPKSRRGEIDSRWEKPSSRFGGFNQGPHYKSTVASKLKSAKKIAAMLEKNSKLTLIYVPYKLYN